LQDRPVRDVHLRQALADSAERGAQVAPETREGVQLRAARWALDDRDAPGALARRVELPHGAQRRTLALRLRLTATQQDRRTLEALETARLLAKHRAFSDSVAQSIVRGLATELLSGAHDSAQLLRAWNEFERAEREMPEVVTHAALRMASLRGDLSVARAWLLPIWERMIGQPQSLDEPLRVKLVRALEAGLDSVDADWLSRIESAQKNNPRDANLQYLAGMACMKRQLWGKAQQLLTQAGLGLLDTDLHRRTWQALAQLAEARGDADEASAAWKRAAQT
jgi:HemY protein